MITRGRPSRAPWPFDLILRRLRGDVTWGEVGKHTWADIGSITWAKLKNLNDGDIRMSLGLMLGKTSSRSGIALIAKRPTSMDKVRPTDYSYSSLPPEYGSVQAFDKWSGGYGRAWQNETTGDGRYRLAKGADASTGTVMKGPEITEFTPANRDVVSTVTGVLRFFEIGSPVGLYALNGRYVHKRTSDADWNTDQKDFGAGATSLDAIQIKTAAVDRVLIGMGDGNPLWAFDGTTYTQHAEAIKLYGRAFAIVGQTLYRANAYNQIALVDVAADCFVEANWSIENAHVISDKHDAIQRLAVSTQGTLVVIKGDGIYSLDALGDTISYFPFLRLTGYKTNGFGTGGWLNDLYIPFFDGLYRLGADFSIAEVGPEKMIDNDTEVHGRITCTMGHGPLTLYAGMTNADTNTGYLLKMTKDGAWHGSIVWPWVGKYPTCLHISQVGAASGHQRMYLGFSDGSVGWFTLPCASNPAACDSYRFTTEDAEIYTPKLTMGFAADQKSIEKLSVRGTNLSAANNVTLGYCVDQTKFVEALGSVETPEGSVDVADNTLATVLEVRTTLHSSSNLTSPEVVSIGINNWLKPQERETYQFLALADDGLIKRDGAPHRRTAGDILAGLRELSRVGEIEAVMPTEERISGRIVEMGEQTAWDERLRKWRQAISVEFVELRKPPVVGTWGRVSAFTWDEIAARKWDELEKI